jgi:predicted ATPase/class 3 adenylate cyclase
VRRDLPSGTVTFLFTDVEGSTRLLHELGAEGYAEALAEHRRVIRAACALEGGVEVDTQGDAFFFAFPTAPGALAAARAAAAALDQGPIRVRMGLHTGTPFLAEEGYVGADIHRAARIAAAGHGGQVLLSASTAALIGGGLHDLGEHRFKDLAAAERVFQHAAGQFPPLRSLYRTNLPVPATPFLGRERELAEVVELLVSDGVRLVTLTGPGGTGKTRLALQAVAEASDQFPDGVFWVPLAPLGDDALVLEQAAQAVGSEEELAAHVGDKRLLLLLDNFEHMLGAAPGVADVLAACPNLVVVVTSRELLQLKAEHVYAVPTLDEQDGVTLFLARARAVTPDLDANGTVAELCARLDNLPLALELAASRTRHLTPEQLLERLSKNLDLLRGGRDADPRQRTLRATIEWSFELLELHEQDALARLAVFSGGWTIDAAEEVAAADLDTLASLVDKSLVRKTGDRFWMLETIREFAEERLEQAGEAGDVRERHIDFFLAMAERAAPELRGAAQFDWYTRLELDHDNLRSALSALRENDDAERGLRLAVSLWRLWRMHDHLAEGNRTLDTFLRLSHAAPDPLRTQALIGASRLAMDQGELERGARLAEEALLVARASEGQPEIAAATENLALMIEEPARKRRLLEESVDRNRALGDTVGTADALNNLANVLLDTGEVIRAAEAGEAGLALQRHARNTFGAAFVLHTLGYVALAQGDFGRAGAHLEECLALSKEFDSIAGIGDTLDGLGHVAAGRGRDRDAVVLWAAGEAIRNEIGKRMDPLERSLRSDALARARERLGGEAFADAWAHGSVLAREDAIEYGFASLH